MGRHPKKRNRMTIQASEGIEMKDAKTSLTVLKRYNTKALVEAIPETGRMHQIRVHLAAAQHPVIGDQDYGQKIKGVMSDSNNYLLQAYYLAFDHPIKGDRLGFKLNISNRILK